jgi:hypothetical protein
MNMHDRKISNQRLSQTMTNSKKNIAWFFLALNMKSFLMSQTIVAVLPKTIERYIYISMNQWMSLLLCNLNLMLNQTVI